jgi:hypothetical protein
MARKRSARRKRQKLLRKIARERELGYCRQCAKMLWPTQEEAERRVERMKADPKCRKAYMLDAYRCQHGDGWHVGHDFKLGLPISLCIGEMR